MRTSLIRCVVIMCLLCMFLCLMRLLPLMICLMHVVFCRVIFLVENWMCVFSSLGLLLVLIRLLELRLVDRLVLLLGFFLGVWVCLMRLVLISIIRLEHFPMVLLHCLCGLVSLCVGLDRKSTRLNSSHLGISYAVF